jgi:hypothetical protein
VLGIVCERRQWAAGQQSYQPATNCSFPDVTLAMIPIGVSVSSGVVSTLF